MLCHTSAASTLSCSISTCVWPALLSSSLVVVRSLIFVAHVSQHLLPRKTKVYRSSRMTKEQARLLFPGEKYRFGMYVCTTTRRSALGDLREWQTSEMGSTVQIVWEMEIPKGCRQASKIQAVSAHADESEVLLVPVSLNPTSVCRTSPQPASVDDVRTHAYVHWCPHSTRPFL